MWFSGSGSAAGWKITIFFYYNTPISGRKCQREKRIFHAKTGATFKLRQCFGLRGGTDDQFGPQGDLLAGALPVLFPLCQHIDGNGDHIVIGIGDGGNAALHITRDGDIIEADEDECADEEGDDCDAKCETTDVCSDCPHYCPVCGECTRED